MSAKPIYNHGIGLRIWQILGEAKEAMTPAQIKAALTTDADRECVVNTLKSLTAAARVRRVTMPGGQFGFFQCGNAPAVNPRASAPAKAVAAAPPAAVTPVQAQPSEKQPAAVAPDPSMSESRHRNAGIRAAIVRFVTNSERPVLSSRIHQALSGEFEGRAIALGLRDAFKGRVLYRVPLRDGVEWAYGLPTDDPGTAIAAAVAAHTAQKRPEAEAVVETVATAVEPATPERPLANPLDLDKRMEVIAADLEDALSDAIDGQLPHCVTKPLLVASSSTHRALRALYAQRCAQ